MPCQRTPSPRAKQLYSSRYKQANLNSQNPLNIASAARRRQPGLRDTLVERNCPAIVLWSEKCLNCHGRRDCLCKLYRKGTPVNNSVDLAILAINRGSACPQRASNLATLK